MDGTVVEVGNVFLYAPLPGEDGIHNLVVVVSDNQSSGGTTTHNWVIHTQGPDFDGDGFTAAGGDCNEASALINPGALEVIGNGANDDCNAATADLNLPPVAGFFTNPIVGVLGEPVQLRDSSTDPNGAANIVDFAWDFGDGGSSTEQNPTHTFGSGGPFTVELTVTDAQGNSDTTGQSFDSLGKAFLTRASLPDLDNRSVLGEEGNDHSFPGASISGDGRWVAFTSRASNLVPGDTNVMPDIFVTDTETGKVVRVSVHTDGTQALNPNNAATFEVRGPVISPDGRFVLFMHAARNLTGVDLDGDGLCDDDGEVPNDQCTPFQGELFVRDRDTDGNGIFDEPGAVSTTMVIPYFEGTAGNRGLVRSTIGGDMSDDARYIAFESRNVNIIPGVGAVGNISTPHVFMFDRQTGEVRNVSKDINGVPVRGFFSRFSDYGRQISADGRYLVWYTHFGDTAQQGGAGGIVGEDTDGDGRCDLGCATPGLNSEVYLYDWQTDTNRQISINTLGEVATYNGPGSSFAIGFGSGSLLPSISAEGRFVAFQSTANNLFIDAFGNFVDMSLANVRDADVYVHDRDTDEDGIFDEPGAISTEIVSLNLNGIPNAQLPLEAIFPAVNGSLSGPQISDDGRLVLFQGRADLIVSGSFHIPLPHTALLHDRLTGQTSVPFVGFTGRPARNAGHFFRGKGRFPMMTTLDHQLVGIDANGNGTCSPGQGEIGCDTNGRHDLFLFDRDPDQDGVFGSDDSCLNNLSGTEVGADGCALPAAIDITKSPFAQRLQAGGTAAFSISVLNNGQATLNDVTVSDPLAPDCDAQLGTLAVNAETVYDCVMPGIFSDVSNLASVSGTPTGGTSVASSASADVDVIHPAITIEKTPDVQTVASGIDFLFTIKVTNTGDVALNSVTVSDALAPGCDRLLGTLAAGQQVTYSCLANGVTLGFTNTADVVGLPPVGFEVSHSDSAEVILTAAPDLTAPVLTLPPSPILEATSTAGVTHSYSATATDNIDPAPVVSCTPPSGSTFTLGPTTVNCTATDSSGNSNTGSFSVTVNLITTAVPPVTNLAARAKGGKVNITWTHVDVPGYKVYRSDGGGPLQLIADTTSTFSVYADFGLTNGLEYCYIVRSVNAQGVEADDSNKACATPQARRRARPRRRS